MRVKLILPALTAGQNERRRRVKYSLWPPMGLAILAGYLRDSDEVTLQDENVETLDLEDAPDIVGIETYVSCARRAYEIADHYRRRGSYVALGGVHVTSLPAEAIRHADTIFLGPGEETWPAFLQHFREGRPLKVYTSRDRSLIGQPRPRRDLIKRHLYVAPNSMVVSRGCPHACDFCSNSAFFKGGRSFYTMAVDKALAEIEELPGRHVYFLDDHIFGDKRFASALFEGMRGMGKIWQSAGTVEAALDRPLLEKAVESGLRTLLVGFETLSKANLQEQSKLQNLKGRYEDAVRSLHEAGVMINGSFVFGMDDDDESVFDRTVEWAIEQGLETATFHILTPYPGTGLYQRMEEQGRIVTRDWDLYDTCHVVFKPARMSAETLQAGYERAFREFYAWGSILRSARKHEGWREHVRHAMYAAAWGRLGLAWDRVIRAGQVGRAGPVLERVLDGALGPAVRRAPREVHEAPAVGLPMHRVEAARELVGSGRRVG